MVLKIYVDLLSQPARAVTLFCRAAKIPHEEVLIKLQNKQHKSEEYTKINPFQKVPTIDHDGFVLTESVAILRYLSRTFPVEPNWYPKDNQAQARVDEYLEYQHLNTRILVTRFFGSIIFPDRLGIEGGPNPKVTNSLQKKMEGCFDEIESVFLKRDKYIAGPHITIADLLAAAELEMTKLVGYNVREKRPIIGNYLERVRSDLNPHYDDVHKLLNKAGEVFKARNQQQSPSSKTS